MLTKLTITIILLWTMLPTISFAKTVENNTEKPQKEPTTNNKKTAYVIETLVQGSQEQPNVIYITPWQESGKNVTIEQQSLQITLPKLTPVTPKKFKKQLHDYYQVN